MENLQNLEVTHLLPKQDGILAFAKYPHWWQEFSFLIQPNGKVLGKTHEVWSELTADLSAFIRAKVQATLADKTYLVYA